jgi:hypothetical protein
MQMAEGKESDPFHASEQAFVDRMMAEIVTEGAHAATHPEDFERLLTALTVSLLDRVKSGVNANWFQNNLRREAAEASPAFKKMLDEG